MSRHGYTEDYDDDILRYGRYRGRVESTIRGRNGQAFLRELLANLDAMPVKELHAHVFNKDGCQCALGVALAARGQSIDEPEDPEDMDDSVADEAAQKLGITRILAAEIMFINDDFIEFRDGTADDSPDRRWAYVRRWVDQQIKPEPPKETP